MSDIRLVYSRRIKITPAHQRAFKALRILVAMVTFLILWSLAA